MRRSLLDGCIEDQEGRSDYGMPDERVRAFINDLGRPIGTHLYGRRMFETMVFGETASTEPDEPGGIWDHAALWGQLRRSSTPGRFGRYPAARTRIEREFDLDTGWGLNQSSVADVAVGGAELAGHAIGAGAVHWNASLGSGSNTSNQASETLRHRPWCTASMPVGPVPRGCSSRTRSRARARPDNDSDRLRRRLALVS